MDRDAGRFLSILKHRFGGETVDERCLDHRREKLEGEEENRGETRGERNINGGGGGAFRSRGKNTLTRGMVTFQHMHGI